MERIKIALVGKSAAGKSFVATELRNNYNFTKMSLQDPTKKIVRQLWLYPSQKRVTWETRWRVYDFFYKMDSNIWVRYLLNRLKKANLDIVVDDVRYINELDMLRASGFTIVRILAPDKVRLKRIPLQSSAAPGSLILHEWFNRDFTEIIRADYTITNISREDTKTSIKQLVEKLRNS